MHAEHLPRAAAQAIDMVADAHVTELWHFRIDGADYVIEGDGNHWSHRAGSPQARADVTITARTDSLTRLIFGGSDLDVEIEGASGHVQRFRKLITTLATVVSDQEASSR